MKASKFKIAATIRQELSVGQVHQDGRGRCVNKLLEKGRYLLSGAPSTTTSSPLVVYVDPCGIQIETSLLAPEMWQLLYAVGNNCLGGTSTCARYDESHKRNAQPEPGEKKKKKDFVSRKDSQFFCEDNSAITYCGDACGLSANACEAANYCKNFRCHGCFAFHRDNDGIACTAGKLDQTPLYNRIVNGQGAFLFGSSNVKEA